MDTIDALARRMQTVLGPVADEAADKSGFTLRRSKLSGGLFAQTLVFGWLSNPEATLEELAQTAAALGVRISPQGLEQRFGEAAAQMMRMLLGQAASTLVGAQAAPPRLGGRFNGVYILDSTTLSLPEELKGLWPGCGGSTSASGAASLKLQVMVELEAGLLEGPQLSSARAQDRSCPLQDRALPAGSLRIADLGYFDLGRLSGMDSAGVFWLSRLHTQAAVFDQEGLRLDLPSLLAAEDKDEVDMPVLAGSKERVECRLAGVRAPEHVASERRRRVRKEAKREGRTPSPVRLALADWTLVVTNAPPELLCAQDALTLYRARWQIETLFKLWKSKGKVASWRSRKPWRIMCEVYAKLLAMLVQHWTLIASCWRRPGRSLTKASATLRRFALAAAAGFSSRRRLRAVLGAVRDCLAAGCRVNRRRKRPATHQLLAASSLMQGQAMAA